MVAKFVQPNSTTQTGTTYKGTLDAAIAVVAELAAQFAVSAQDTPNMSVVVRAGRVLMPDNSFLTYAGGNSPTLTAPTTNDKVVFVCFRLDTGAIALVNGAESSTPAWPLPPVNYLPLALVYLTPSTTVITNSIIAALPWYNLSIHHLLNRANIWNASQTVRPGGDTNTELSIQKQGAHLFFERSALDAGGGIYDDWKVNGGNGDFDLRIERATGANGDFVIANRGTGNIRLRPNNGAGEVAWDSTAKQTSGTVPLTRLALNAGGAVFDTADKMTAGTVPLTRMGSVVANSSQLVSAGATSSITIDSTALGHKFFVYSLYNSGSSVIHGTLVDGSEAVVATLHSVLNYGPTGTVLLSLINGFASDQTVNYKVYKLTET